MFSSLLEQLQPVCVSEQKFLTSFFRFAKPVSSESLQDEDEEEEGVDGLDSLMREDTAQSGVHSVLGQLLGTLLPEIEAFIAHGERMDN